MLERLTLKGFQRHEDLTVKFDPHLTVIVGRNNAGKSAIIRALKWLCLNKRPKDDFTTWGKKKTNVKLVIDGHTVVRKKAPKLNQYSLDGKKFNAVNKDVPPEVRKRLNITDINFQGQSDPIFWFSLSAPQLSKELNSIVNLSVIDSSLSWVGTEARKAATVVEVTEDRVTKAKEGRKRLKWIKEADRKLSVIESLQKQFDSNAAQIVSLESFISGISSLKSDLETAKEQILRCQKLTVPLQSAVEIDRTIQKEQKKIKALECIIHKYQEAKEELCEIQRKIELAEKDLRRIKKNVRTCPLCGSEMNRSA